jgi:chlorophyllase
MSCIRAVCPDPAEPAAATPLFGSLYVSTSDPYADGRLPARTIDVMVCERESPVAMRLLTPDAPGRYAVIVFQHGFISQGVWYSDILTHLATHGFVVVAPQMYPPVILPTTVPNTQREIELALRVLDWLPGRLSAITGVEADTTRLGLAGHSRGGKVAWGVLSRDPARAMAVAGLDPVDGSMFNPDRVINGPFGFPLPSLIIGAGLAAVPAGGAGIACAPEGENHVQFYEASAAPAWHVVAPAAGHADFYDADCRGCGLIVGACRRGDDPAAVRRLTQGLLVAFFRGTLQGDAAALRYLTDAQSAPVPIVVETKCLAFMEPDAQARGS